jgi:hypothetical protein
MFYSSSSSIAFMPISSNSPSFLGYQRNNKPAFRVSPSQSNTITGDRFSKTAGIQSATQKKGIKRKRDRLRQLMQSEKKYYQAKRVRYFQLALKLLMNQSEQKLKQDKKMASKAWKGNQLSYIDALQLLSYFAKKGNGDTERGMQRLLLRDLQEKPEVLKYVAIAKQKPELALAMLKTILRNAEDSFHSFVNEDLANQKELLSAYHHEKKALTEAGTEIVDLIPIEDLFNYYLNNASELHDEEHPSPIQESIKKVVEQRLQALTLVSQVISNLPYLVSKYYPHGQFRSG